jgi:uncharacterized protein DUF3306
MSDEDFLKRWSRRKQEAKTAEVAAEVAPPVAATETPPAAAPEQEIDLSKLPPLDSITAATDITEFLRQGIPAELRHAALRRAWAADPAIRDFVGLAENAWDFTDPNAMPGFGALQGTPEQISAMVERVIGGVRETAEKLASELSAKEHAGEKADQEDVPTVAEAAEPARVTAISADRPAQSDAAVQPEASHEDHDAVTIPRRTHGGALPS